MALPARLATSVTAAWRRRGAFAWVLSPAAALYAALLELRRWAYRAGALRSTHPGVPVVVVGNLYVGGTGKTPLTIALVRALQRHGFHPGIVSRGYGAAARGARLVSSADDAADVGDEPLLLEKATAVPVAVGARRADAAAHLLQAHPSCDVLIADDGLQHLALARDVELAVLDERLLGNGWVLPAGPLREAPSRLAGVDAIVLHGAPTAPTDAAPCFRMTTRLADHAYRLRDPGERLALGELARRQRETGLVITAAAGIGVPERFFAMLEAVGLRIERRPLPDHFDYRIDVLADARGELVLITEKDAVKCARAEVLANAARIWVVPLEVEIDPALVDLVVARLNLLRKTAHGPPAA